MKKLILSVALIATGFTCSYAASIEDMTKDALINSGSHTLSGTFGAYDFDPIGDKDKFDWAFTLANGKSYQLRGNAPSDTDVFGWKAVDIVAPKPAWYMFQVDVDGDGLGKFDWVLLGANSSYATKLKGVADSGSFDYTGKLDVDYKVSTNGITTGAVGTLDAEVPDVVTPPVEDDPNTLHVNDASSLHGYTIVATQTSGNSAFAFTIDCSGNFAVTYSAGGQEITAMTLTGNEISIDGMPTNGGGIDFDGTIMGDPSENYIGFNNQTQDIVVGQSTPDGLTDWSVTSIVKNSTCHE